MSWLATLCSVEGDRSEWEAQQRRHIEESIFVLPKEERMARSNLMVEQRSYFQLFVEKKRSGVLFAETSEDRLNRWQHEWEKRELDERERNRAPAPDFEQPPCPAAIEVDLRKEEEPEAYRHKPLLATNAANPKQEQPMEADHVTVTIREPTNTVNVDIDDPSRTPPSHSKYTRSLLDTEEDNERAETTMEGAPAMDEPPCSGEALPNGHDLLGEESLWRVHVLVEERACFVELWRLYTHVDNILADDEEHQWLLKQRAIEEEEHRKRSSLREKDAEELNHNTFLMEANRQREVARRQNEVVKMKREMRIQREKVEREESASRARMLPQHDVFWGTMVMRYGYETLTAVVGEEAFWRQQIEATEQHIFRQQIVAMKEYLHAVEKLYTTSDDQFAAAFHDSAKEVAYVWEIERQKREDEEEQRLKEESELVAVDENDVTTNEQVGSDVWDRMHPPAGSPVDLARRLSKMNRDSNGLYMDLQRVHKHREDPQTLPLAAAAATS